jgi:photosystem II stability/assembly factor-like uncharacterized protein
MLNCVIYKLAIKILIVISLFTLNCVSDWSRTEGPGGGRVNAIISHNGVLLVGAWERGIFRSIDGGDLWEKSNSGLPYKVTVKCFGIKGDTLYAGTFGAGVYRSIDDGKTWVAVNTGLTPLAKDVNTFLTVGNHIFIGASFGGGIWITADGGETWARQTRGVSEFTAVYSFAYMDGRIFAASSQGILVSNNMGERWNIMNVPFAAHIFYTSGNYIFAGARGEGLRRSADNGESWIDITTGLPEYIIGTNAIVTYENTLYLGTGAGTFKSYDWGNSWRAADEGLPLYRQIFGFAHSEDGLFAIVSECGVYKEMNGYWIEKNKGLILTNVSSLYYDNGYIYAATRTSGLFRLNILNEQWQTLNVSREFTYFDGIKADNNRIFASASGYGVYRSFTGGLSWSLSSLPVQGIPFVRSIEIVGTTVIVGLTDYPGIFVSTDNGSTWRIRNNGLTGSAISVYDIKYHKGILYAGTSGGVYTSGDLGNNWKLKIDVPSTWSLHFAGDVLYVGSFGGGIIRSFDYGKTWEWVNNGLDDEVWITSITSVRGVVFAGSLIYGSVFKLENNGEDWENISDGLPDSVGIRTLASDGRKLYAGMEWYGVWQLPLHDEIPPVATDFMLYQNYPNPFNSSTVIRYFIPQDEFVTLKIYNVLGQELETLKQQQLESGEYYVAFESSGYPSGVYFYRVTAGSFSKTKKLTIIR